MVKIFLGGFPLDTSEMDLVMLVSPHGTVDTIKIVRDKKTGVCKGYAFLEMANLDGANTAKEMLDGTQFKGKTLTLNVMEEKVIVAEPPPSPAPVKRPEAERFSFKIERTIPADRKKRPRK